ncbi:hypothetical protein [Paenibacillus donghaensis]|uniref:Uncharacterized protein n=1 Tax=Paenibacillus donghaensis TaxID=414771 RepID=A0A2Z2K9S1_9BACL|nr:hypothetical protein [Paenibacillus donghaensis]ASA20225.1 hypothetical protein B9T62_05065 [Paenibacillus donghaensis]
MFFFLIVVVVLFSVLFIFKDEKQELLRNFSLLSAALSIILSILLLNSALSSQGASGFQYLDYLEVDAVNVFKLIQSFMCVTLISLVIYFYTLTRRP